MSTAPDAQGAPPVRMLDWRSGWVLIVAAAMIVAVVAWRFAVLAPQLQQHAHSRGDGRNVESYGFDLSHLRVPRELLVASGQPRAAWTALNAPRVMPAVDVTPETKLAGVRKLRGLDRVIGVEINGEARAYPVWVLTWHEVANDTLGGTPILVTYSPLCDSAVVFDRVIDGEIAEFGVSGLLYNSNLVMFDRRTSPEQESLWSQLGGAAISGPAAENAQELTVRSCSLTTWSVWREKHPRTTVVPPPHRARVYIADAFLPYFGDEKLRFPVAPLPSGGGRLLKTPMACVLRDDGWRIVGSTALDSDDADRPVKYGFWFALHAFHATATTRIDP